MKDKRVIRTNLISGLIGLVIGIVIFLLYFLLNDHVLTKACDASALAGVVLLAVGTLMYLSYLGAFDTFEFGFRQLGTMMFNRDTPKKETYGDYIEGKKVTRRKSQKPFFGIMISSVVFFVVLGILEIIYHIN